MQINRYLLKYYYIGSKSYFGSQRQKIYPTIEESILDALKTKKYIQNQKSSLCEFASRTDRYVSARGAAFSFVSEKEPILMEINSVLPRDIGIWAYCKIPIDFLSRYNAVFRHYKYIFAIPFEIKLNLGLMREGCKKLEGKHDFINFSKRNKEEQLTIRDMDSVDMDVNNEFIVFDFVSRAFLRQQIRRMVKKLIELGTGDININDFMELFDSSKEVSFQPASPSGLILWDIKYDNKFKFEIDKKSYKRMIEYFKERQSHYNTKQKLFTIMQEDNFSK